MHWSLLPQFHEKMVAPHIHKSLDRNSLLAYLFEAHIYPAKRMDYLGNPIVLSKHAVKDEDWVETIVVAEHENDLAGA